MKKLLALIIAFTALISAVNASQPDQDDGLNHVLYVYHSRDGLDTLVDIRYRNICQLSNMMVFDHPDFSENTIILANDLKRYMEICGNFNWTNDTIYAFDTYEYMCDLMTTYLTCSGDTLYALYGMYSTTAYDLVDALQVLPYDSEHATMPDLNGKYEGPNPGNIPFNLLFNTDFTPLHNAIDRSYKERQDIQNNFFNVITRIEIRDGVTDISRVIYENVL